MGLEGYLDLDLSMMFVLFVFILAPILLYSVAGKAGRISRDPSFGIYPYNTKSVSPAVLSTWCGHSYMDRQDPLNMQDSHKV